MAHTDEFLQEWKQRLARTLDLMLKLLPSKDALYYKEKLAKMENANAELKEELLKATTGSLGYDFEQVAKSIASHFNEVCDRIEHGDRDCKDLLDYCDVDKMLKNADDKFKQEQSKDPDAPKTLIEMLRKEKPGIEFDENDKKAICNELISRGYVQMIDYFDSKAYLNACLEGKIEIPVNVYGDTKYGIYVSPETDETLIMNLSKTISQGKEYIIDTIIEGGDTDLAYNDSMAAVADDLQRLYYDRMIYFDNPVITQDNFFMYGDVQVSGLVSGTVVFTYDKENHTMDIKLENCSRELTDDEKSALETRCYDLIDAQIEKEEYEKQQAQEQRGKEEQEYEEENDPYGERTLYVNV